MAFIEPRLIHLLNDSTTPQPAHADLPPIRLTFPIASERPLPLEPGAGHREDKPGPASTPTGHVAPAPPSGPVEDSSAPRKDAGGTSERNPVGNIAHFPLRLLLGETDTADSSFSLSKILDETPEYKDDAAVKKRHRALTAKDDFVQLPQPVKKQKATQQQVMPPIINGLHEPPPDAALFPPIASNEFDEPDTAPPKPFREFGHVAEEQAAPASPPKTSTSSNSRTRKKAMKPRRKWTEAETNHLLLGVDRHGVGKWTDILADPDFNFNNRTAGDLKDRFRTCCPAELRSRVANRDVSPSPVFVPSQEPKTRTKSGLLSENILIDPEETGNQDTSQAESPQDPEPVSSSSRTKKSRAHRKKMTDLAQLGIHGPFKKSRRRERRPFSEEDDRQILEGLDLYGPAWTKIQRDIRFSLSGRQPTDLRDRVRNKYPAIYQRIEKGLFQIKETRGNDTLEPSVSMTIENSLQPARPQMEPQLNRSNSRDELPRWHLAVLDAADAGPLPPSSFEFGEPTTVPFIANAGEMDISRLLLDDSQLPPAMTHFTSDPASDPVSP